MIGVRVSKATLRKIDRFAEVLSANRTETLRFLLEAGMESYAYFLRRGRGRGRGMAGRVVQAVVAGMKAKAAERAAKRSPENVEAEIKALRAREHADELVNAESDRIALAKALKL